MAVSFSIVFLIFCLICVNGPIITPAPTPSQEQICQELENRTVVETIPRHKYRIAETCLLYRLKEEKPYDAEVAPKSWNRKVAINFPKVAIQNANLLDRYGMLDIEADGYLIMTWKDNRLTWNPGRPGIWDRPTIRVHSPRAIWVPDLRQEALDMLGGRAWYTYMWSHKIILRYDGLVNATMRFGHYNPEQCEADHSRFPDDTVKCCLRLQSTLYAEQITFQVPRNACTIEPSKLPKPFKITSLTAVAERLIDGQGIKICLSAIRSSPTLKIELTLPMALSALLVLIAPFFRNYKALAAIFLFSLLFQLLCLQILVLRTSSVPFGQHVPALFKFYQLTMAITMISLIITMLTYAFSRMQRMLPPPHSLVLKCQTFNRFICCGSSSSSDFSDSAANPVEFAVATGIQNGIAADGQSSGAKITDDWVIVCEALSNLLSLILVVVYLIGLLAIFV